MKSVHSNGCLQLGLRPYKLFLSQKVQARTIRRMLSITYPLMIAFRSLLCQNFTKLILSCIASNAFVEIWQPKLNEYVASRCEMHIYV